MLLKLLALDTATEACSCALYVDGVTRERFEFAPRRHAELLLAMVDACLDEAGLGLPALDALAFGRGPGAFTGVRIAAGVVQGLALGASLPVAPVSTLQALAQGALEEAPAGGVLAGIDARMGELYCGFFAPVDGVALGQGEERVCAPQEVTPSGPGPWLGVGTAFGTHAQALRARLGAALAHTLPARLPRARDVALIAASMARAGRLVAPEEALPVYLRDRVAVPPRRLRG